MPRISLRELLVFVTLAAVAIVSLKYASPLPLVLIGAVMLLAFLRAIIIAIFDRGPRQAFAIGFTVIASVCCLVAEAGFPLTGSQRDPASVVLSALHDAIATNIYIDQVSGRVIPADQAQRMLIAPQTAGSPALSIRNDIRPDYQYFRPIGNLWFQLLFGYLGGRFAQFVYLRRITESSSPAG